MPPVNKWLPSSVGLLVSAVTAIVIGAPFPHPYNWFSLFLASIITIAAVWLACAGTMFLCYVVLPAPDPKSKILRTSSIAAFLAPLTIVLQQRSLWAPLLAAFVVWAFLPTKVNPKPQWMKFGVSIAISVLVQIGFAFELGDRILLSALLAGMAAIPIAWRIRQERTVPGPPKPRITVIAALLLAIVSLMHYLPIHFATGAEAASAPPIEKSGVAVGGRYRGVILIPEPEEHITLVLPLPMMGRDPFLVHKDPIGIPFYGVYWFYQFPDRQPAEDAVRKQGSPDTTSFRSADRTPLKMEARQNLGRFIDVHSIRGIDIAIRNADSDGIKMELVIVDTAEISKPFQFVGQAPVGPEPKQTLSFTMPSATAIQHFDELSIRFVRPPFRGNKSAKIAIERFFLVPR